MVHVPSGGSNGPLRRTARRSPRPVRVIADLGLILLPVLLAETLTGLVLFAFAHGLTPKDSAWAAKVFVTLASANLLVVQDITFQTDVHVWVGYLTTWAIALKAVASWQTLVGWWPSRLGPARLAFEKVAAASVLVLGPASYLTGVALTVRHLPRTEHLVRDVHLWVSALLVVPLAWHVVRFLPTGLRIFRVQLVDLVTPFGWLPRRQDQALRSRPRAS